MARLDVPDGPGGEAAMIWTLRPQLGAMVERMIRGAYQESILPADERELARMRIAQINDCVACSDFRAPSVLEAAIPPELYENVAEYATYPGYTPRQRLAIEYAVAGLRQSQINPKADVGFPELLRSVLRQSPDVMAKLNAIGQGVSHESLAEATEALRAEAQQWKKLIAERNIQFGK